MENPSNVPFDWLKYVNRTLLEHDDVPLFGTSPSFPWEKFSSQIADCFSIEDFKIRPAEWQWRNGQELLEGLGDPLRAIYCKISPLAGTACLLITEDHFNALMSGILTQNIDILHTPDDDYREAFARFILLEAIFLYGQLGITPGLTPSLSSQKTLPESDSLSLDLVISIQQQDFLARFLVDTELRKAWKEHHSRARTLVKQPLAQDLEVSVSIEVGKTTLTPNQWSEVSVGDYLVLDSCSAEPGQEKGRVLLTVNGRPAFRGMIKDDKIKILEYPLYHEAE